MAIEQGLYAQVVVVFRKDLEFTEANKNKNKAKFKFQGHSARSQHWFGLDFDLIDVNFIRSEPYLYGEIFRRHDDTQDTNTSKIFEVPIGNSKCVENIKIHSNAPMLRYFQKSLNCCCFSSLASTFSST